MSASSELDKAALKHDMRQLYNDLGFTKSLQILAEMLIAAEVLAEVIVEERGK